MPDTRTDEIISEMAGYAAVLFDWDGTLADTHTAHYQALRETMAPFQIPVDWQWFIDRTGVSAAETIQALASLHGCQPPAPVHQLVARCEERYCDFLDAVSEVTWVADIARALHGRKPIAVASGGMRRSIEATMTHLGLTNLFDDLVAREDAKEGKPSPEIFQIAAHRLGVDPRECLVFEDSDFGILAATRAGMSAIDVRKHEPLA
ncbi:HAD family hydrolase [Streptomyces phaeochromogenes]|uniref:HAD family hydrolase n=1 Tax=Streptomyces phaeochromogenes TaxID=1923 RepID=UPI0036BE3920